MVTHTRQVVDHWERRVGYPPAVKDCDVRFPLCSDDVYGMSTNILSGSCYDSLGLHSNQEVRSPLRGPCVAEHVIGTPSLHMGRGLLARLHDAPTYPAHCSLSRRITEWTLVSTQPTPLVRERECSPFCTRFERETCRMRLTHGIPRRATNSP